MRVLLIVIWMLIPVAALAYHLGPGQAQLKLDRASQLLQQADQFAQEQKWTEAHQNYGEALSVIPESETLKRRQVRLERDKALMMDRGLNEAFADLMSLVNEMQTDSDADAATLAEAQSSLASAQFYRTWLMRLEGQPREIWEPQIESAQMTYRMLAENSSQDGNHQEFLIHTKNLESAIQLARMDVGELQGLPLPSQ